MIVIGSNTSDNGPSCFTEDISHFMELRQNRQLALLKRSAKNGKCVLTVKQFKQVLSQVFLLRYDVTTYVTSLCKMRLHFWNFAIKSRTVDSISPIGGRPYTLD